MITTDNIIDQIMLVMEDAFDPAYGEAWNRRQITDALVLPTTHALLVDPEGLAGNQPIKEAAGFVLSRAAAGEEELLLIAVRPQFRSLGLGLALIESLFKSARQRGSERVFLEMRRGNPAEALYRKVGFEPVGERPNYYRMLDGNRVDAITFGCSI